MNEFICVDLADKQQGIPEFGAERPCGETTCPGAFETGYGLAGGGMGPYKYCDVCGKIVSKSVDKDGDE